MKPTNPTWPCVVFRVEGQRYALHLSQVKRVVSMVAVSPLPKAPTVVVGVINHRGSVVPVLDLRPRFGFPSREFGLADHLLLARTTSKDVTDAGVRILIVEDSPTRAEQVRYLLAGLFPADAETSR